MDENAANQEPTQPTEITPRPSDPSGPQHGPAWIFWGKNGIRAGWGILLFIIVLFLAGFAIFGLLRHFAPHVLSNRAGDMTPSMGLFSEGLQVVMLVIATGVMALIERKSILAYGYRSTVRAPRFIWGLIWGFVAISVLVFALWASGLLIFDGRLLHGGDIARYAVEWGIMFLLVGIFEESMMRGYVQFTMTRGVGFWWGALLFSFLFGFAHHGNAGESPVGLVSAGLIGLVFCISLWYTGSLWWAVGFHAAWDWGQSYFYGTLDSGLAVKGHLFSEHPVGKLLWTGGKTGPEGSWFILPEIALIALFMWLWWGRRTTSPFADSGWRPAWSRRPRVADEPTLEKAA